MTLQSEKELMIQKLIQEDATIASEMESAESLEALQVVFANRGLTLTEDEVAALMSNVVTPAMEGELGEDDLDNVAGGISIQQAIKAFMFGARVGIGARMLYDYYKYGNAERTYTFAQLKSGKFWA